jgi:hypothetical protein
MQAAVSGVDCASLAMSLVAVGLALRVREGVFGWQVHAAMCAAHHGFGLIRAGLWWSVGGRNWPAHLHAPADGWRVQQPYNDQGEQQVLDHERGA